MQTQLRTSQTVRGARRALSIRAALAAAGVFALSASFTSVAEAKTICAYSGAPANVLTVTVSGEFDDGVIERHGLEIAVGDDGEAPQPCAGGTPTVLNTDTILARVGPDSFLDVRLRGGAFAPGATAESEGAAEIEIQVTGSTFAAVIGTSGGDEFHWGPGGDLAGLNLNPRSDGDQDVDVTISGENAFLIAAGAAGSDTIVAQPGTVVPDGVFSEGGSGDDRLRAPEKTGGILDGGPGDDIITGSRFGDLLSGDSGDDRVSGRGGADRISGGRGKDRLLGGAGRDNISSRDATRDTVSCGTGRDRVRADRRDRVRGCEKRR